MLKLVPLSLCAFLLLRSAAVPSKPAQMQDSTSKRLLVPVHQGFKYGYIDRTGKLVIAPQFRSASEFEDGLAQVQLQNGKLAYINEKGDIVFSTEFDIVSGALTHSFSEGMAAIKIRERYGYVDRSGQLAIAPQFETAGEFSGGFAAISQSGKIGFVDKTGKVVIAPQYFATEGFAEGFAVVQVALNARWGFIDSNGTFVIPPQFDYAGSFSEGLAPVVVENKLGFIDRTGKLVIPYRFEAGRFGRYTYFSEGLAAVIVRQSDGAEEWGYINKNGGMLIAPQFYHASPFSEGFALVAAGTFPNVKWGYIDKTGSMVIPADFVKGERFRGGLAKVCEDVLSCSYIDASGNVVWDLRKEKSYEELTHPLPPPPPPPARRRKKPPAKIE